MPNLSPDLEAALKAIQHLSGPDFLSISKWLRGNGRADLRERGATDEQIGPVRFDIDKFDDAPLG